MTEKQAIEWIDTLIETYSMGEETELVDSLKMAKKALEQQPSEDKVIITMDKGTLKYSGKGYVVYNKDWFKKHFATEVEIMTGYDGYKEQPTSNDCVSREQVEKIILNWYFDVLEGKEIKGIINLLDTLPPVTLTHGTCKDCKHWKDSDGVYRRGVGAESKCPINIKEVYEGTFYCKDFKKRGSEE